MPPQTGNPPAQPPNVSSQMGAGAFSGIGQMMADRAAAAGAKPEGSAPNPFSGLQAEFDAVQKVVENMARKYDGLKPYANRAIEMLKEGVMKVTSMGQPMSPQPEGGSPAMAKPPEGATGQGFPG